MVKETKDLKDPRSKRYRINYYTHIHNKLFETLIERTPFCWTFRVSAIVQQDAKLEAIKLLMKLKATVHDPHSSRTKVANFRNAFWPIDYSTFTVLNYSFKNTCHWPHRYNPCVGVTGCETAVHCTHIYTFIHIQEQFIVTNPTMSMFLGSRREPTGTTCETAKNIFYNFLKSCLASERALYIIRFIQHFLLWDYSKPNLWLLNLFY